MDERMLLLELKADVEEKLKRLEQALTLANPMSHNDDQHKTLIKKVRAFRNALNNINSRLGKLRNE